MSCTDCESNEIKYAGNGSQTQFTFPFTYMDQSDVYVELFNYTTRRWVRSNDDSWDEPWEWSFANATTIEFTTAPPIPEDVEISPTNVKIGRCTNIDPLSATFYPGSAIRAQDLNDNFQELQLAILEGRCQVPEWFFDYLNDEYWDKFDDIIDYEEQINDPSDPEELVDDEHIFTAAAIAARHDAFVQDNTPPAVPVEQAGKIWNDTDDSVDYFWEPVGQTWVSFTKTGPPGPIGEFGPPGKVIIADNPPLQYPAVGDNEARDLESGDLWWDSNRVLLYVYYTDNNSSQWVAVSKSGPQGEEGPQGPAGNPGADGAPGVDGAVIYNFIEPLQVDGDNNVSINLQLLQGTP